MLKVDLTFSPHRRPNPRSIRSTRSTWKPSSGCHPRQGSILAGRRDSNSDFQYKLINYRAGGISSCKRRPGKLLFHDRRDTHYVQRSLFPPQTPRQGLEPKGAGPADPERSGRIQRRRTRRSPGLRLPRPPRAAARWRSPGAQHPPNAPPGADGQ